MKIAIVADYNREMSGVARSVDRIVKNLNGFGIEIILITSDYKDDVFFRENLFKPYCLEEIINDKLKVFKIGPISKRYDPLQPGFMASQSRNFYALMMKILEKESPQIIHGFYILKHGLMSVLAGKKLQIPSIVSVRGNDISRDIFDHSKFSMIRWTLDNADFITFVNDLALEDSRFFMKNKNYKIILNSCETKQKKLSELNIRRLKENMGLKENSFVIGFCGAVREKKGVQYLLESFEMAKKKDPSLGLLIMGEIAKDFEKEAYYNYLNNSKFKESIIITGKVSFEEVDKYYQIIDLLCVPSLSDGLNNSLLEGLSFGLPIIASDIFSNLFKDGEDLVISKSFDSKDLYEKILSLKEDKVLRERLSKNSQKLIKEKFSTEREAKEYLEVYNQLIK